jgi:hypothetical protein
MNRLGTVGLVVLGLFLASCHSADPTYGQLSKLIERRASRTEVESVLGPGSVWYGRDGDGGPAKDLRSFLDREPSSWGKPVRQAVQRGQGVLYYTSAWQMTWFFFNESDRLVGYWITTQ